MKNDKDLQFAKTLAKYKGKWIALQDSKVIASGDSVSDVQKKAARKKITNYAFHFVPTKRLAM